MRPISDADVELLHAQVFVDHEVTNLQWADLALIRHQWDRDGLLVEPGENRYGNVRFCGATRCGIRGGDHVFLQRSGGGEDTRRNGFGHSEAAQKTLLPLVDCQRTVGLGKDKRV